MVKSNPFRGAFPLTCSSRVARVTMFVDVKPKFYTPARWFNIKRLVLLTHRYNRGGTRRRMTLTSLLDGTTCTVSRYGSTVALCIEGL